MSEQLNAVWRAACVAVENSLGLEDADPALARFTETAQSANTSRAEVVSLLVAGLDQGAMSDIGSREAMPQRLLIKLMQCTIRQASICRGSHFGRIHSTVLSFR